MDATIPHSTPQKQCTRCKQVKPLDDFHQCLRAKDKRNSHCKQCDKGIEYRTKQDYKDAYIRCTYGLSREEYNEMLYTQKGVCASCGMPEDIAHKGVVLPLSVDHCHVTGAIRGLLCQRCNRALGDLCDDPERIEALIKYTWEKCQNNTQLIRESKPPRIDSVTGQRLCSTCGNYKHPTCFDKNSAGKDGLRTQCRQCGKERAGISGKKIIKIEKVLPDGCKRCYICKQVKSFDKFFKDNSRKDKCTQQCRDCDKKRRVPELNRNSHLKVHYALTTQEYNEMLRAQNDRCAVCRNMEDISRQGRVFPLSVDHCHRSGVVRGLLCIRCNRALGVLNEDPHKMEALLRYTIERVLY